MTESAWKAFEEVQITPNLIWRWIREGDEYVMRISKEDLEAYKLQIESRIVKECEETMADLEQAEKQEPVAWMTYTHDLPLFHKTRVAALNWETQPAPLYTAPPQREWVGLTDEQIKEGAKYSWVDYQAFQSVAWWADEKLKENNA